LEFPTQPPGAPRPRRMPPAVWFVLWWIGLAGVVALLTLPGPSGVPRSSALRAVRTEGVLCRQRLQELQRATLLYADAHEGYLPPAASWADALVPQLDGAAAFHCPEQYRALAWPGTDYALNAEVAGKQLASLEAPGETVLFFETTVHLTEAGTRSVTGDLDTQATPHLPGGTVINASGPPRAIPPPAQ